MNHQIWVPSKSGAELFLKSYNFFLRYYKRKESHYKQLHTKIFKLKKKKSLSFKSGAGLTLQSPCAVIRYPKPNWKYAPDLARFIFELDLTIIHFIYPAFQQSNSVRALVN